MKLKKWLKIGKWVVLGAVIMGGSLWFSMKTYLASVNRKEVQIAQVGTGAVKYTKAGQVRVYFYNLVTDFPVVPGQIDLFVNGETYDLNADKVVVDAVEVEADDSVAIRIHNYDYEGGVDYHGYVAPTNNVCGLGDFKTDITKMVDEVEAEGEPIESVQCWSEYEPGGNPVYEYDDVLLILSYVPGDGPNPSGSGFPSLPPLPSMEPKACYEQCLVTIMCETGLECKGEELLSRKCVNPDCPEKSDCDCGGTPSPSPSASSSPSPSSSPNSSASPSPSVEPSPSPYFPPEQPDTGTPTWLTLAVMVIGAGLISAKFLFKAVK